MMKRLWLSLFVLCVLPCAQALAQAREYVVIMPGMHLSNSSLKPLATALIADGYAVVTVRYPEEDMSLDKVTDQLFRQVTTQVPSHARTHFVSFSTGALALRAYLKRYRPEAMGRAVMLVPPKKASEIDRHFKAGSVFAALYGMQTNAAKRYGHVDYDLGVMVGDRKSPAHMLDDEEIIFDSEEVAGLKDHLTLTGVHAYIVLSKAAQQQTAYFLKKGKFERWKRPPY